MKKIFSICILALDLLLITGCGSKDSGIVKCTIINDGTSLTTVATFNNNKITEVSFESSLAIPDELTEQEIQQEIDLAKSEFNKMDGVTATMEVNGSSLVMNIKLDMIKVSDDTIKQFNENVSLDTLKTSISMKEYKDSQEKQGFTCE